MVEIVEKGYKQGFFPLNRSRNHTMPNYLLFFSIQETTTSCLPSFKKSSTYSNRSESHTSPPTTTATMAATPPSDLPWYAVTKYTAKLEEMRQKSGHAGKPIDDAIWQTFRSNAAAECVNMANARAKGECVEYRMALGKLYVDTFTWQAYCEFVGVLNIYTHQLWKYFVATMMDSVS